MAPLNKERFKTGFTTNQYIELTKQQFDIFIKDGWDEKDFEGLLDYMLDIDAFDFDFDFEKKVWRIYYHTRYLDNVRVPKFEEKFLKVLDNFTPHRGKHNE